MRNLVLVPLAFLMMNGCSVDKEQITYVKDNANGGREAYSLIEKDDVTSYKTYIDYGPDGNLDVIYDNTDKNKQSGEKTFIIRGGQANFNGSFYKGDKFVTSEDGIIKNLQAEFNGVKDRYKAQEWAKASKK